jgi:uncharacterized delta-60 repeat protein
MGRGAAVVLLHVASTAVAGIGGLDPSFGTGGIVTTDPSGLNRPDTGTSMAIDGSDRIVVAGYTSLVTGNTIALTRYTAAGALDGSFGSGGTVVVGLGTQTTANGVAIDGAGNIVVVGDIRNGDDTDILVMRFDSSGSADGAFGAGGVVTTDLGLLNEKATDVAIDALGRIVVTGYWLNAPAGSKAVVARYLSTGALDATFGSGGIVQTPSPDTSGAIGSGIVQMNDVEIDATGAIVIAGAFGTHVGLARYLTTGTLDPTFGTGGTVLSTVSGLATGLSIDGAGRLAVAGFGLTSQTTLGAARFLANGALDTSFGTGGVVSTTITDSSFDAAITHDGDGRILVAGGENGRRVTGAFIVLRLTPFGIFDPTFGTDGVARIEVADFYADRAAAIAMTTGDRILVGGSGDSDFAVAALFGGGDCGDGVLDAGEDCDTGGTNGLPSICCSGSCAFDGPSKACRPSADECDAAETCTGSSVTCPVVDAAKPAGTVCNPSTGICDPAETCDGTSFSCPADVTSVGPDTDSDGMCDAGDLCTNVGGAQSFAAAPRSKLLSTPVKLVLSAGFALPPSTPFSGIDPTADAVRLTVNASNAQLLEAIELPTSGYSGPLSYGWVRNTAGTKWTYRDKLGRIGGIKKMTLGSAAPGIRVKVSGRLGVPANAPSAMPVEVVVTLGDQSAALAGSCGESTFDAASCQYRGPATFKCRK